MSRTLDDVLSVTGAGQDDAGRVVLNVLMRDGGQELLRVTDQAATEMLYAIPMAVLGRKIRGSA